MEDEEDTVEIPDWFSDEEGKGAYDNDEEVEVEVSDEENAENRIEDDEEDDDDDDASSLDLDDCLGKFRRLKKKPRIEKMYSGSPLELEPDDHIL